MPSHERLALADGRAVVVRPIEHGDLAALKDAIEHADAETLRRRFLGGAPPRGARLAQLVDVDQHARVALVAETDDGEGVGIARYEPTDQEGVAEPAVVVKPEWRNVGLATALLRCLAREAIANGYCRFRAAYLADNAAVERLVHAVGLEIEQRIADGVADVYITLPGTLPPGSDASPP